MGTASGISGISRSPDHRWQFARWQLGYWRLPGARATLRPLSASVLLGYVVCHLVNHSLLLVSVGAANAAHKFLLDPWRTDLGTTLLVSAALVHYCNFLWSIYVRRHLRLVAWEWTQLLLGLCIPPLLMLHVMGTRVAEALLQTSNDYTSVLVLQWISAPWLAIVQVAALLTVWIHASIGMYYWLRTKRWYRNWARYLLVLDVLIPALALAGYVSGGNQVLREARNPDYAGAIFEDANITPAALAKINEYAAIGWSVHGVLILLPLAGRSLRRWADRIRKPPMLTHSSGRVVPVLPGATVLETLREHGITHASVCGGRARCTTCRVQITSGLDRLHAPNPAEASALARIKAPPGLRLACQIRPSSDLAVLPILPANASAADGSLRGGLEGSERFVTVMFVDLRESTSMAEMRLPYDVLFILNQFFQEMTSALDASAGHYSQFTGDGFMALYGLDATDPGKGPAAALHGARDMLGRLAEINRRMSPELSRPLKIGIGIHFGEAIVGSMGPPGSRIVSAIGDAVNTAARLEQLSKEFNCPLILSRQAAEAAGLPLAGHALHEVPVKGRVGTVAFYALQEVPAVGSNVHQS